MDLIAEDDSNSWWLLLDTTLLSAPKAKSRPGTVYVRSSGPMSATGGHSLICADLFQKAQDRPSDKLRNASSSILVSTKASGLPIIMFRIIRPMNLRNWLFPPVPTLCLQITLQKH